MSTANVAPLHGAVALGTYLADFNAFRIRAAQGVESVTPFGSNTCSKNLGAGTPDFAFSISAALLYGTTATNPNIIGGAGMFNPHGLAGTFTLGTGCSLASGVVVGDADMGAARMRAAEPIAINGKNYDDPVLTWATSGVISGN